ncbi:hypothetical protein D0Z07_2216 [Hyphodiscus hymeniophilus]|uniref:Major facilitator superfamily (MFS) profile domain-containing protein n=1 Tax=Hyphodiscus hymeniophilus TaxID=353542 RepID=A0A9P7AYY2_9HELO|nr:hypothetical protein D0Z07_2216 [Hyphodiscus hymeniophilus]
MAASKQGDIELQIHRQENLSVQHAEPDSSGIFPESPQPEVDPKQTWKLFSAGFSFFVAGINDGSMGALLPYMLREYNIGTSSIAILYFTTFLGWLVAALTNSHAPKFFGLGALLSIGATLQLLSQSLRAWQPPFGLFAVTFFITGLGQAYQDSHANTFVSSVKTAHRWLGFIHAMYGFGCLVSPFVATAIASADPPRWMLFYLFPLGMSALNLTSVIAAFWRSVTFIRKGPDDGSVENTTGRNSSAMNEVRQVLKLRNLWIISCFYFVYLGVSFAAGGWVVQYLVSVRHGNLATMGYVPSGYYGGAFLGRVILAEPTHRYGERRMLSIYAVLCFAMQLVFWLVPNIISSAVAFSLMGFLLGPAFAAGVSVASRLFPKEVQPAALVFVIAQAGGAVFPSLIGLIASHAGVKVLQPIVAGLIVLMGVTWAFVPKPETHRD